MDLRDPKTQKLLLGALVVFLVLYFWYARIYSKNATLIEQKQVLYENLLTDLKTVEMKAKSFENLKKEYEKLIERYHKVERLLPEEKQIHLFLMQMHSAASANQTGIIQVVPQGPVPMSFYNVNSYDIEITGSYHHLGGFLSSVGNFPFLTNVSGMTIAALPQEEQIHEQKGKTITASMKLTTYYVKEEEKLKKVEF